MEPVTHICGVSLWRHETAHPAPIVLYANSAGKEIHACPRCGASLADSDLVDSGGVKLLQKEAAKPLDTQVHYVYNEPS